MDDSQKERMQRNREAALLRLQSRNASVICPGQTHKGSSNSLHSLKSDEPGSTGAGVLGELPTLSPCSYTDGLIRSSISLTPERKKNTEKGSMCRHEENLSQMPSVNVQKCGRNDDDVQVTGLTGPLKESFINRQPLKSLVVQGELMNAAESHSGSNVVYSFEPDGEANLDIRVSCLPAQGCDVKVKHKQPTIASVLGFSKAPPYFDYLVVIDFEATCDNKTSLTPQEIIEFPAVLVNLETLRIQAVFRTYVKPVCHPRLTEFCKRLTGIQQEQVDNGVPLGKALQMHDVWLEENNVKGKRFVVVTWSDWDCKVMLESECKWKSVPKPPYFNRWINLKVPFRQKYGDIKTNLKGSVELTGRSWEGRQHSGLDDAKNTAYLALELVKQGVRLQVTNSFKIYNDDGTKITMPLLKRPKVAPPASSLENLDTAKKDLDKSNLMCHCGVKSKKRLVKKPGLSHGREFFSCGKWSITAGGKCDFFVWATTTTVSPNPLAPVQIQANSF